METNHKFWHVTAYNGEEGGTDLGIIRGRVEEIAAKLWNYTVPSWCKDGDYINFTEHRLVFIEASIKNVDDLPDDNVNDARVEIFGSSLENGKWIARYTKDGRYVLEKDANEVAMLKKKALAKLTTEEIRALGIDVDMI